MKDGIKLFLGTDCSLQWKGTFFEKKKDNWTIQKDNWRSLNLSLNGALSIT